jgi:hypothetical protein
MIRIEAARHTQHVREKLAVEKLEGVREIETSLLQDFLALLQDRGVL